MGATSNYFRLRINALTADEVVRAETDGFRRTPLGGGFFAFAQPLAASNVQPFQPGNPNKRDGFIDFRVKNANDPRGQLFNPGDEVSLKVTVRGKEVRRFKTPGGLWRTGDGGVGVNTTQGSVKLTGATVNFDPDATLFNDLDIAEFGGSDAPFGLRNLRFIDNLSPAAFAALDLRAVFDESLQSSLPRLDLSSSEAMSPIYSEFEHLYANAFSEPDDGNFVGVFGQIVDPVTGRVLGAFQFGAAAVPEPATVTTVGAGLVALLAVVRRRAAAARG
jgi:hypothetical protein